MQLKRQERKWRPKQERKPKREEEENIGLSPTTPGWCVNREC